MSSCSCYSNIDDDETQSFWKRLASKYEKKIRKLTEQKREISQRLEIMQLQMPACLYRNMMKRPEEAEKRLEMFMKSLLRPEELPSSSKNKCTCDPCPIMIPDNFPENLYNYQYSPIKTYVPRFTKPKTPIKVSNRTLNKNLICSCKYCAKMVLKRLREEKEKELENNYEFMVPEKLTYGDDIRESTNAKNESFINSGECTCCTNMGKTTASACDCRVCAEEVIKRINSPDVVFEPFTCGCDGNKNRLMEDVDIPICQCVSCKIELNRRLGIEEKEKDKNACFCNKNLEVDPNRLCDCNICAENLRKDSKCSCNNEDNMDGPICHCETCKEERGQKKDQKQEIDIERGCLCECDICNQLRAESPEINKVPSFETKCVCACDICIEAKKENVESDICSCTSVQKECVSPSLSESCECPSQEGRTSGTPSGSCECSNQEGGTSPSPSETCECSVREEPKSPSASESCECSSKGFSESKIITGEVSSKSGIKDSEESCTCSPSPKTSKEPSIKSDTGSLCICSPSPSQNQEASDRSGDSSSCVCSPSPRLSKEASTKSDASSSCKCFTIQTDVRSTEDDSNVKNVEDDRAESGSILSCLCIKYPSPKGTTSCNCSGTSTEGSMTVSETSCNQKSASELSEDASTDIKSSSLSGGSNTEKAGLISSRTNSTDRESSVPPGCSFPEKAGLAFSAAICTDSKGSALSRGSSSEKASSADISTDGKKSATSECAGPGTVGLAFSADVKDSGVSGSSNTERKCSTYSRRSNCSTSGRIISGYMKSSTSNDLGSRNVQETNGDNPKESMTAQVVSDIIKTVIKSPNTLSAENSVKIILHQLIVNDTSPSDFSNEPNYDDDEAEAEEVDEGKDGQVFRYAKQLDVDMFGTSSESSFKEPEQTLDSTIGTAVYHRVVRQKWSKKTSTICSCMKELDYENDDLRPKDCATDTESCCCLQIRMDKFDKVDINEGGPALGGNSS